MPKKKPYTRDSIERALVHHKVEFIVDSYRARYAIETGIGTVVMTEAETYHYVIGLADKERLMTRRGAETSRDPDHFTGPVSPRTPGYSRELPKDEADPFPRDEDDIRGHVIEPNCCSLHFPVEDDGRTAEWYVVDGKLNGCWGPMTEVDAKAKQNEVNATRGGCDVLVLHESQMHILGYQIDHVGP